MKTAKLKTCPTYQKKATCRVRDKLVKLREDTQLSARCIVVQQSRPTLVSSLGDTIAKYEFPVIPRSLFSSDGLLLIPTDKSAFIHVIEHYLPENTVLTTDHTVFSGQETVEGETNKPRRSGNIYGPMYSSKQ